VLSQASLPERTVEEFQVRMTIAGNYGDSVRNGWKADLRTRAKLRSQLPLRNIPVEHATARFLDREPAQVCAAYALAASRALEGQDVEPPRAVRRRDEVAQGNPRQREVALRRHSSFGYRARRLGTADRTRTRRNCRCRAHSQERRRHDRDQFTVHRSKIAASPLSAMAERGVSSRHSPLRRRPAGT